MVIFDFDQTLVDTSSLASLRTARNWREVNRRAVNLTPYPGITKLLEDLSGWNQELAIVTHSPSMVAESFVARYNWPIDTVLGYHQIRRRKPDPKGLLIALHRHDAEATESFHVGDRPEDTYASRGAQVISIGAGWGSEDLVALEKSSPDHLFTTVTQLHDFFRDIWGN